MNTKEKITQYRESSALNYSTLKKIQTPFFIVEDSKDTQAMAVGSLVDCLIGYKDEFDDFFVVNAVSCSDNIKDIMDRVIDSNIDIEEVDSVVQIIRNKGYQDRMKDDLKLYEKVKTEGNNYYNVAKSVKEKGLKVIDNETFNKANVVYQSIMSGKYTQSYFRIGNGIEIQYQLPVYFKYRNVDCKGLLDMVIFDHDNMTIQGIDVKTMGDYVTRFKYNVTKYSYHIQGAWYESALKDLYPDYQILDFKFMVESTGFPGTPIIFNLDAQSYQKAIFGYEDKWGNKVEGIEQLMDRFVYASENDEWQYPMEVHSNGGIVDLNIF